MFKNLIHISEVKKEIDQKFLVLNIVAFAFVKLNTYFYREKILLIRSQYVSKQFQDFRYY